MTKTALITGAASGIGKACALRLAREGVAVGVLDLNLVGCEGVVAEIQAAGGKAVALQASIADRAQVNAAVDKLRKALGPVTILVNNAGISNFIPFEELTDVDWDKMFEINTKGTFIVTQVVLPDMKAAKWGRIVNISSSSAQTGAPAMAHYVASKGGVIGFTKALAVEFAAKGITVNNIPPGFIDTPMLRGSPVDVDGFAASTLMKRAGQPEDIAAACSYLASEAAGYVTGHTLSVGGGRYM